jgi:hypothetical protein
LPPTPDVQILAATIFAAFTKSSDSIPSGFKYYRAKMIDFPRPPLFAAFCAAAALVSPLAAEQGGNPDVAAEQQPGFLDIARNPDATAEQKRTVSAIMDFVKETDPAAAFEKLKASDTQVLYGGGDDGLSDLTPISQFTGLKTLVLFNHRISDLTPLGSLQNLRTLRLEVNRISDISPLAKLTKLESLQIDDNLISDLRPLSGLARLETLWISNNRITDISPLKGLRELRNLHLTKNKVTDLKVFSDLSLCDLRLGGNGIIDISALRDMNQETTCFISLDLSDNAILDVSPLSKLGRVTTLNLANNRIADTGGFLNPALTWVDLQGNKLSRVPDLRGLSIIHINLRRNPIDDYADLVAFKKESPMVEILADEEFTRAFEGSFPVIKELEGSLLLGIWRTDLLETEWGPLVLELRFTPSGVFYQGMLPPEPDQDPDHKAGIIADGRFTIRDDRLEMTVRKDTSEQRFEIENDVLTLGDDGNKLRYRRFTK